MHHLLHTLRHTPATWWKMASKRWSKKEIETLIAIWGDEKIQGDLDGAVRNKSIYQQISRKWEESGYMKDWKQCKDKIKNLKQDYKKAKAHNNKTGNGRKAFMYYTQLNEILGNCAAVTPPLLLEFSQSLSQIEDEDGEEELHVNESDYSNDIDGEQHTLDDETEHDIDVQDSSIHTSDAGISSPDDTSNSTENEIPTCTIKPEKKVHLSSKSKKSTFEKAAKEVMEVFMKYQEKSEEMFYEREDMRKKS